MQGNIVDSSNNPKIEGTNSVTLARREIMAKYERFGVGSGQVVTVVEHSTHNPKIEGSDTIICNRRYKMAKTGIGESCVMVTQW